MAPVDITVYDDLGMKVLKIQSFELILFPVHLIFQLEMPLEALMVLPLSLG